MAKETKYSLKDLRRDFPTDDACLDFLFDTLHSRDCSCGGKYSRLGGRAQYQCSICRYQIAPMSGTIFHKTTTSLTLWFHAIWIFSNAKSGISAKELERQLGVTYKTAWRILHLIRKSLRQKPSRRLKGRVEMDETYFGGKGESGTNNENHSEVLKAKSKIIGAMERGGEMRAKKVRDLSSSTIGGYLKGNVEPKGTILLTDESNRYDNVAKGYNRVSVNHSKGEYALGEIHVNHMESFWSHVKRSTKGTFKAVSPKHLQEYLDAFVWHYNNRHSDRERFLSLLGALVG